MVICAQAGTPLREIEALIAQRGQMLPFEPMDHRALYGTRASRRSAASSRAIFPGPRRISAGAARDALIGLRLVNGRGEIIKSGGRVMKNVTGLDLVKLNCGAHGTLGLITEATFKLLPKPECEASIVIRRLDDRRAIEALSRALGSPFGVSGAAHISAGMGREFPRTFLRLEGFRASVDYRIAALLKLLAPFGAKHALEDEYSERSGARSATRRFSPSRASAPSGASASRRPKPPISWRSSALSRMRISTIGAAASSGLSSDASQSAAAAIRADAGAVRRPCDAGARARRSARDRRRVRAAVAGRCCGSPKASRRASIPTASSTPAACIAGSERDADQFLAALLADPHMQASEKVIRSCVHCGFCTATCPTYLLLGDELDSPRGRIYLIKDMLENNRPAPAEVVKHVDRCLSCLACMTTCPSGVHYMHLVDHARAYIEATYQRPLGDRLVRAMLARVLPSRNLFRAALLLARIGRPLRAGRGAHSRARRATGGDAGAGAARNCRRASRPKGRACSRRARGPAKRRRVALLTGCAQAVLAPQINAATIRLLNRAGVDVVLPKGEGCCGSLVHHMGREERALAQARANIDAWMREIDDGGLEAIVVTASGCGTTIKDYGFMLRDDPALCGKSRARLRARQGRDGISRRARSALCDSPRALVVAYHSACSMQHGQKITTEPKTLLRRAGFVVRDIPEGHICCGSAGTYNILQPEIAERLRERKVANIARVKPDVIAAGNIGCITQIARRNVDPDRAYRRASRLGLRRTGSGWGRGIGMGFRGFGPQALPFFKALGVPSDPGMVRRKSRDL